MTRNRIAVFALMATLAWAGISGWKFAVANTHIAESKTTVQSVAKPNAPQYHNGPISTWSAYQPIVPSAVPAPQVDHTPAYDVYEQAYGDSATE